MDSNTLKALSDKVKNKTATPEEMDLVYKELAPVAQELNKLVENLLAEINKTKHS